MTLPIESSREAEVIPGLEKKQVDPATPAAPKYLLLFKRKDK
jgi:hypothetical protein